MEVCVCFMSFLFCIKKDKLTFFNYLLSEIRLYGFRIIIMAICITVAMLLLSFSVVVLPIILIISLSLFMKLIRVLYGYYFLKEKLNNRELLILLLLTSAGIIASLSN
jgi:drug/metabolite transporter (DMT)-like permease